MTGNRCSRPTVREEVVQTVVSAQEVSLPGGRVSQKHSRPGRRFSEPFGSGGQGANASENSLWETF